MGHVAGVSTFFVDCVGGDALSDVDISPVDSDRLQVPSLGIWIITWRDYWKFYRPCEVQLCNRLSVFL